MIAQTTDRPVWFPHPWVSPNRNNTCVLSVPGEAMRSSLTSDLARIAWAAGDSSAGCAASFTPLSIADTLDAVDERIYPTEEQWAEVMRAVEGQDANGDGVLCIKQFKPNKGQDKRWGAPDYVITQVFDNIAKGRL